MKIQIKIFHSYKFDSYGNKTNTNQNNFIFDNKDKSNSFLKVDVMFFPTEGFKLSQNS